MNKHKWEVFFDERIGPTKRCSKCGVAFCESDSFGPLDKTEKDIPECPGSPLPFGWTGEIFRRNK